MFNFSKEKEELKEKVEKAVEEVAEDETDKVTGGVIVFNNTIDTPDSDDRSLKQTKGAVLKIRQKKQ